MRHVASNGSKPGGSDDMMNDETICLSILSEPGSSAMPSTKNIVEQMRHWRHSGEPCGGFVALFVHSYCCTHDYMGMFHNNAGFLVLQIIFEGCFTRFQAGLPTLGSLGQTDQHGRVEVSRVVPALWLVLYSLGEPCYMDMGTLSLRCYKKREVCVLSECSIEWRFQ